MCAMANNETAFIEQEDTSYKARPPKNIKLGLNEDGTINWDSTPQKHIDAFLNAVKIDPNGILQNIKEEAGEKISEEDEATSGIADTTVLTCTNIIMMLEAVGICTIGPRYAPILKNLHPAVAAKACAVSIEEIKPILPAGKRIIKRYIPDELLSQEWQDIFIVGEKLMELSTIKFKACLELAAEIEKMKAGQAGRVNGPVVIDAETSEVQ